MCSFIAIVICSYDLKFLFHLKVKLICLYHTLPSNISLSLLACSHTRYSVCSAVSSSMVLCRIAKQRWGRRHENVKKRRNLTIKCRKDDLKSTLYAPAPAITKKITEGNSVSRERNSTLELSLNICNLVSRFSQELGMTCIWFAGWVFQSTAMKILRDSLPAK